jgi:hypothetical protein
LRIGARLVRAVAVVLGGDSLKRVYINNTLSPLIRYHLHCSKPRWLRRWACLAYLDTALFIRIYGCPVSNAVRYFQSHVCTCVFPIHHIRIYKYRKIFFKQPQRNIYTIVYVYFSCVLRNQIIPWLQMGISFHICPFPLFFLFSLSSPFSFLFLSNSR